MSMQSVTVEIPTNLYIRLKRRAEQAHRSIEAEVVKAVADALPADNDFSDGLQQALLDLSVSDEETLYKTAQAQFPAEKSARLEVLHLRRQAGEWNDRLAEESARLSSEMEEFIFLRAHAMSLLMQRGINPTDIVNQ